MQNITGMKSFIAILVVMLTLFIMACASTRESKSVGIEKLLEASGFKMGVADSPEKLEQLKELPQRKLVSYEEGDKTFYIYVDVEKCKCAYAGDEEAYKKYQTLSHSKQRAEDDRREAVRNQQRQIDDDDWSFDKAW